MRNSSTPRRTRPLRATLVAGGLLAVVSGALGAPAGAATDQMKPYEGNFSCAEVAPPGEKWSEFKLDFAPTNGSYEDPDSDLVIEITDAGDTFLSWASNVDIAAVLMKGGPGGNAYLYEGHTDLADINLVTPVNPNGGQDATGAPKKYGISHVSFCHEVAGDAPGDRPDDKNPPVGDDDPGDKPGDDQPQGNQPQGDQPDFTAQGTDSVTDVKGISLADPGSELPRTGTASIVLTAVGALLVALGMTSVAASRIAARQIG